MQQRPGRTLLTMLSIVIGVTAAVAVGLGTETTRHAYKQMFEMVTGRATLEVDGRGGKFIPGELFEKVAQVPGVQAAVPLIDKPTSMTIGDEEKGTERRVRLQILGIVPDKDKQVRDYDIVEGRQVKEGDEIVLEKEFARHLDLKVGSEVRLLTTTSRSKPFQIVGIYSPLGAAAMAQISMAFMPLERAQFHFNNRKYNVPKDAIDKIQIVTAADAKLEEIEARIAAILPEAAQVHQPAASTQLMKQTLLSTEQGLTLTTRFSLLMAFFIIINTFFMNITERRRHLSIMRAIGATRQQIRRSLMSEAVILGLVGTVLGLLLGVGLAYVGTNVVARSFDVQLPRLVEVMTPWPFIAGAVFGMGTALIGAFVPAIFAGRVSPLEGMNRSVRTKTRSMTILFLIVGLVLTIVSGVLIFASIYGSIPIDRAADLAIVFLVGLVLLNAVAIVPQATLMARLLAPMFPVESKLALKQVLRNQVRSVLTMGVLFIVGSTGVGMANSILDCVRDIHEWFNQAIVADFVVRAMMPDMAKGNAADLPEALGDELRKVANVQSIDEVSFLEATVPAASEGADEMTVFVIARNYVGRNPDDPPNFDLISGDRSRLREQLYNGEVVLGSVLAQKLKAKVGDKITLKVEEGTREFPICGVANEYMVGGLEVHMFRKTAIEHLGVTGVDGYMVNAMEGHRDTLRPELEKIGRSFDVFVLSQSELRKNVDRIVAGTEWSLWLLVVMGFVVAAFGIVNTLTMNVLEQTRELGLLRIVAMTKKQVRRTIEAQALIIGGIGLPQGILVGVFIAWVLNLAMMPSIGHPIDFHVYPGMLIATFIGAVCIVMVAAMLPARRATKIDLVEALHYE